MANGSNRAALEFAIRAQNDSQKAFDAVSSDLDNIVDDADRASKGFDGLQKELDELGQKLEENTAALDGVSGKLDGIANAGGNLETTLRGVGDLTGFLSDQFGVSLGPIDEYSGALGQLGGGIEAALSGGPALLAQLKSVPATLAPAIAATRAYVTALYAQATAFIAANAPIILLIAGLALLGVGIFALIKYWDEITAMIGNFGTAAEKAKEGFDKVTLAAKAVLDFMLQHWPEIAGLISGPFAPIVALATDAFGVRSAIQDAFTFAKNFVKGNWPEIATIISGPFFPIVALATDAFGVRSALQNAFTAAKNFVGDRVSDIGAAIGGIPGMILGHIEAIGSAASGVGAKIASGIIEGIKTIATLGLGLGDYVLDAIRGAINSSLAWLHNNVRIEIPGFDPPGPGNIPGFTWSFPSMSFATGGITSGPMMALIGDNPSGQEAVIPLDSPAGQRLLGGGDVHIHIEGNVYGVDDLIRVIDRALKRGGKPGLAGA